MANFYISDLHIGHENILRFDNRPFADVSEMNNKLIENWNARVHSNDTVYILILLQFFFHSRLANNNSVDGMQYALGMQIPQKQR